MEVIKITVCSKCFPSKLKLKAVVFKFMRFEDRFRKASFSWLFVRQHSAEKDRVVFNFLPALLLLSTHFYAKHMNIRPIPRSLWMWSETKATFTLHWKNLKTAFSLGKGKNASNVSRPQYAEEFCKRNNHRRKNAWVSPRGLGLITRRTNFRAPVLKMLPVHTQTQCQRF